MVEPVQPTIDSYVAIFHDGNLNSQEDAHRALNRIATRIENEDFEPFLNKLLSFSCPLTPLALELILSSIECGQLFSEWLLSHFPLQPKIFCSSSAASILARLSSSLLFECPFERDLVEKLRFCRLRVENAPRVLMALSEASFPNVSERDAVEDEIDPEFLIVRKTQRQRKGAKCPAKIFNPLAEKALGVFKFTVPSDSQEAEAQITAILEDQQNVLKFYLESMQRYDIAAAILTACVHREVPDTKPNPDNIKEQITLSSNELASTPAAFPMVQPMKAALYFESAEGFGDWRILISTRADRDLRDARRKDSKFFRIIVKKIKELSNGHFSDDNHKRLNGQNTEIPIYEAKMTRDSRLVYHIDCLPEYDADVERQVIKIFGVYTHAQIDNRLWDSVGYQLGTRGKEYRHRCTFRNRPHNKGDNVFTPACFPPPDIVEEEPNNVPELPCDNLEEIHSLLVLEKFVAFSQALLNSIIADLEVAHVFNVTPQEKQIIEYPYSCYVLGRSGTGKTTTMLFKMLGIERAYVMRKDSMPKPRQLFVTQSRVLAGKVEEYFSKLLDSLSTAEKTREELAQFMKSKRQRNEEGLIDIDDDQTWRADLPSRFSQLQDEHFPLFLTFDRLTSLLEADLSQTSRDFGSPKDLLLNHTFGSQARNEKNPRLITYTVFLEAYWPHLSQKLTKGLDPALVFSELMGVIQGSEEALCQENRFLDKATYQKLSHRTQYAFASRRDTIHSIFMLYLKQKRNANEYDAADRTHRVLNAIQDDGVPGQKIDYLYVDEAQDNLLIDALFLRSLVRNPDGLFWAGDTAQTISVGSSFRFNDLKAFLYRLETRRGQALFDNNMTEAQEAPRTFQLAINYRSHGGIVQCAHSVIELITEFWPYAIDVLSREKGVVDGSKPVFFSGWDSETVRYEQFLFGESGNPIEFGARQCILVRDDAARDELRRQVGEIGLIMTLYESKGLEFDDVLLYKFFEDSTVDLSQWRVVLNSLESQEPQVSGVLAPRFDEVRHAGVCSELKFLYVAITRARKNLWIVDCSEKGEPMRALWTSRNQIQNCTPGTDVPRLAVSSSPEEWGKSGMILFQNKRYLQAMHCFDRAGLNREVAVSHTYYLREQARLMPSHGSKQQLLLREKAFSTAAEAFLSCAISATIVKEKKAYLRSAARCFEDALDDFKAAQVYAESEAFTIAAKLYRKCAKFDEAVAIVTDHRPSVEPEVAENIIDVARLFYFKSGELDKASRLFNSVDEELEYLEDFDLDVSRAAVLENLRKYEDAAEIHLREGRTLEAIRLLLMDGNNQAAIQRGNACILQGLWEHVSFGVKKFCKPGEVARLLALASKIKSSDLLEAAAVDELTMFEAIKAGSLKLLRTLSKRFVSGGDRVSAVLCLDHCFQPESFPNLRNLTSLELSELLHDFLAYCQLLETLILAPNPCNSVLIRKLFRIYPSSDNILFLPNATFLHSKLLETRVNLVGSDEEGILISEWELTRKFKEVLMNRLLHIVKLENDSCHYDASAFNPCLPYIVNRQCNRPQCPRQHIEITSLTRSWYNLQVRIHLQQILIFQTLHTAPPPHSTDKIRQFRYWIGRLYETLYPPSFHLGTVANLDIAALPEAKVAFNIAKMWSLSILYSTSYHRQDAKLLTMVCQTARFCYLLDNQRALDYICNAPVFNLLTTLPEFLQESGGKWISVVPKIVHSLLRMEYLSIPRGALFVKQVVDKLLPIDINVLCDIVDYLCGAIILVLKNFVLHNVTLPRSWFIALLPNLKNDPKSKIDIRTFVNVLIESLGRLLDRMCLGKDLYHLLYENSDLDRLFIQRATFISRICRAMGLVGYNFNNIPLRDVIHGFMKLLNGAAPNKPHNLYKDYAYARTWNGVAAAIQRSTNGSPLDEMVQLYHESHKGAPAPPDVHRVIYKSSSEVIGLLHNSKPTAISNLRPDAPVFVPRPRVDQTEEEIEEPEQEIEEPEVDNTDIIGAGTSVESITVTALPEANLPPSEKQIHAACVIQAAYRKTLRRRHKSKKTTLEASRSSVFDACLEESLKMEWPSGNYYRLLFLGPLPHVLVSLSAVHSWAIATKAHNKKRLKVSSHQELEDIGKRLTEHTKVIKDLRRLQEALNPQSELHRKREVETLKNLVMEVEFFLASITHTVARDVKDDMAIATKGIVALRKPPKPKQKPTVKIDDDNPCNEFEHRIEEGDDINSEADLNGSVGIGYGVGC